MADSKCELISKNKITKWKVLKCTLLNAHSLENKYAQICSIFQEEIDIIFLAESHLSSDIRNCEIIPPGYQVFRRDRNRNGGEDFCLLCP